MQKARFLLFPLVAAVFAFHEGDVTAQVVSQELFLLEDVRREQWCAYKDEARWTDAAATLRARHFASIDFVNGTAQTATITLAADSGDWTVEDTYSLAPSGNPRRLRRRIIHESGGFIEESVFTIEDGRAQQQRQETKSLYSGQVMDSQRKSQCYFFADPPILSRLSDFAFRQLLAGELPEVWTRDTVCVKSSAAP